MKTIVMNTKLIAVAATMSLGLVTFTHAHEAVAIREQLGRGSTAMVRKLHL